jgi:hypothetical protein
MMIKLLLLILFVGCSSGPSKKELAYQGEEPEQIRPYGLIVGKAILPKDSFPHNNRKTIISFQNVKTKEEVSFGKTKDLFYMKLNPGEYILSDIWDGGMCMGFLDVSLGRSMEEKIDRKTDRPLTFEIEEGKVTNIGDLLPTCLEWDATKKMEQDFKAFTQNGKFSVYSLPKKEEMSCRCKVLVKEDSSVYQEIQNKFNQK